MKTVRSFRVRVAGRTLIELAIAMAIGLGLSVALIAFYLSSAQTSRWSTAIGRTLESGHIVMYLLGDAVRTAGYGEIVSSVTSFNTPRQSFTMFSGEALLGCTSGTFATGATTCASGGPHDALMVASQGNTVLDRPGRPVLDCAGSGPVNETNTFGLDVPVARSFFFVRDGQLVCRGRSGETVLLDDVEAFKVFYGFDAQGFADARLGRANEAPTSEVVLSAAEVTDRGASAAGLPNPWNFVVSVHVCLRVRTTETGTAEGTHRVRQCPATAAEVRDAPVFVDANDGIARRTFMQVFTVRGHATVDPTTGY